MEIYLLSQIESLFTPFDPNNNILFYCKSTRQLRFFPRCGGGGDVDEEVDSPKILPPEPTNCVIKRVGKRLGY